MRDGEWQLTYPGVSQTWGVYDPSTSSYVFNLDYPDLGDTAITSDDTDRPREDGVAFGSDYHGGRTIGFHLGLYAPSEQSVLLTESRLARAWRGDSVRFSPGQVATLTTLNQGRQRTVFGRPRRYTAAHKGRRSGYMEVTSDFACVDDMYYGPEEVLRVDRVPPPSGGIVSPLSAPITTIPSSTAHGALVVAGDNRAYFQMEIHGPIANPVIEATNHWALSLLMTLGATDVITLDSRTWARTITRQDGASFAGSLAHSSRLSRAYLDPGTYDIALEGSDGTGTAYMVVRWRAAYAGLGGDVLVDSTTVETVTSESGGH